eukprot:g2232.t1
MQFLLVTIFLFSGISLIVKGLEIPKPTDDILSYQYMEMGGMVTFNMATTAGTQGCSGNSVPDLSSFNDHVPLDNINTDQWCEAIASFGGKYTILVAKHLCGFTLWDGRVKTKGENETFVYNYSVPVGTDIVRSFAKSCAPYGIKLGIYYSVNVNVYLNVVGGKVQNTTLGKNQVKITQEQYNDIVIQHLSQLWGNYGDLAEIWFDGGYDVPGLKTNLLNLLNQKQPHATVFGGCGLAKNPVAWIGTESGHAPGPIWDTSSDCKSGAGVPNGSIYIPKEVDLTLQNADTWFYHEGTGYKSLSEMVSIYHDSVGYGGNMLLNLEPPTNTTLPKVAMDTYKQLGDFIRNCYGEGASPSPTALASTTCTSNCNSVKISINNKAMIDRILIKEELRNGQNVESFAILADGKVIANGTAIGRSLILRLDHSVVVQESIELRVESAKAPPTFRLFAIPDPKSCVINPGPSGGCNFVNNTQYSGPIVSTSIVKSLDACCTKCRATTGCAAFVAKDMISSSVNCSVLTAMTGSKSVEGVVSGSPK